MFLNFFRSIFFISGSIFFIIFSDVKVLQFLDDLESKEVLTNYYSGELENIYIEGFSLDRNGCLTLSQREFESAIAKCTDQMLQDKFNRGQIECMKNEARKVGQQIRRINDRLIKEKGACS